MVARNISSAPIEKEEYAQSIKNCSTQCAYSYVN